MDNPNQEIQQEKPAQPETQPQQPTSNSSWLKTLSIGLGVVGIGIVIGVGGYLHTNKHQNRNTQQPSIQTQNKQTSIKEQETTPNNSTKPTTKQTKFSFLREGDIWVSNDNNQKKITDYKHNYSIVLSSDSSKIAYFSTLP